MFKDLKLDRLTRYVTPLLVIVLLGLIGYTAFNVLAPLPASERDKLVKEIVGEKIVPDQEVIERIEKRQEYGRETTTDYVEVKRARFEATGIPTNPFDQDRVKKCYSDPRPEDC